jgi:hypothetical protein
VALARVEVALDGRAALGMCSDEGETESLCSAIDRDHVVAVSSLSPPLQF